MLGYFFGKIFLYAVYDEAGYNMYCMYVYKLLIFSVQRNNLAMSRTFFVLGIIMGYIHIIEEHNTFIFICGVLNILNYWFVYCLL